MTLRTYLEKTSPELHNALARSWEIAMNEWLPLIGTSDGSFNSYPHLRNLEIHLDQLLFGCGSIRGRFDSVNLTGVEAYLLLCAVLFHDIGRTSETKGKSHGKVSEEYIKKSWPSLGILSAELAYCLGDICWFHNFYGSDADKRKLYERLCNTVIDPYGNVREMLIASLLMLADCMDGSHTRTQPYYIKQGTGVKGAFRGIVSGIFADPDKKLIKTIISSEIPLPGNDYISPDEFMNGTEIKQNPDNKPVQISGVTPELIETVCGQTEHPFFDFQGFIKTMLEEQKRFKQKDEGLYWPVCILLAIIMNDVDTNGKALAGLRDGLSSVSLQFKAWLIEYNDHLYANDGRETFEPIFTREYLNNIIKGIWDLSLQVFGVWRFTYENLAVTVRDINTGKVRAAVRRLAIILNSRASDLNVTLHADEDCWYIRHPDGCKPDVVRQKWIDAVKELEDPLYERK